MRSERTLTVELLDTWRTGTGRAEGATLDATVDRDAHGLPHVPGRMLRGLLRDAVECLQAWGHVPQADLDTLFGALQLDPHAARELSQSGCLRISSATLRADEVAWLSEPGRQAERAALFLTVCQTAIDPASGTVLPQTLRAMEVAVPMRLSATLEIEAADAARSEQLWKVLELALPLVRAIGAQKTRGHGRARLSWAEAITTGATA